jgi:hypothetical protein
MNFIDFTTTMRPVLAGSGRSRGPAIASASRPGHLPQLQVDAGVSVP